MGERAASRDRVELEVPSDGDVLALRQLLEQLGEDRERGRPRTEPSPETSRSAPEPKFGDVLIARSSVSNQQGDT
jgi:hypothetical protein